jgi:lysosomal Pro-X carboxypeptidase
MWELAPQFGAIVVFLEHRYEGESLPDPSTTLPPNGNGCMAYASSIQAIADAAYFIQNVLFTSDRNFQNPSPPSLLSLRRRPVIAFGGSYGGMLAAWLRVKYPSMVAGAIAASAPIWGLPLSMTSFESGTNTVIDSAYQVIAKGLSHSYPPSETNKLDETTKPIHQAVNTTNHCPDNLLAVWPLIKVLSMNNAGRKILEDSFLLCKKLSNETNPNDIAQSLIEWAQSPWFDLAEGSYPYPSSYISYALTHETGVKLPSWPVQSACWRNSSLYRDIGIHINGNRSQVQYSITYGDSDLMLYVDWDSVSVQLPSNMQSIEDLLIVQNRSSVLTTLLTNVRDAVGVWYNASLDLKCFDVSIAAPNSECDNKAGATATKSSVIEVDRKLNEERGNAETLCKRKIKQEGSWPSLNCNEEMNLILTYANGLGNDVFWPPTLPRTVRMYSQALNTTNAVKPCADDDGIFGYSQQTPDPWSGWYDTVYGGTHIQKFASNIVFSNGNLDPWSAAGVLVNPTTNLEHNIGIHNTSKYNAVPGLTIQYLTPTIIAVNMDLGGHHTDLMYSNAELDPLCVTSARLVERDSIDGWIKNFWDSEPG